MSRYFKKAKRKVKRKISKVTRIPTTRSGRRTKAMRIATGGGCLIPMILMISAVVGIAMILI